MINLSRCHYDIMRKVIATEKTDWVVSTQENFYANDWDLFWQDGAIESEKLQSMKPY